MFRKIVFSLSLILFVGSAFAQDCDSKISDDAHVLTNPAAILSAITALDNAGADARVLTRNNAAAQYPEAMINQIVSYCQSWQSDPHHMKNNLVVFFVSPANHKVALFYGHQWDNALADSQNIKSGYMIPAFRDRDWDRGIVDGINQSTMRIKTFNESILHPKQTVVNNQATDLSGFWIFLYGILAIIVAGAGVLFVISLFKRKHAAKDAQQNAIKAMNLASEKLRTIGSTLDEKEALKEDVTYARALYSGVSEDFSRYQSSETYNPNTDGLTEGQYNSIQAAYNALLSRINTVSTLPKKPEFAFTPETVRKTDIPSASHHEHHHAYREPSYAPSGNRPTQTTVINNNGGNDLLTGVLVGEALSDRHEDRPSYSAPSYDPPSSSDDSSFGGSSSSWGSDSSSSDSGSSSDFSSSSDSSFGGGSSDF